MIHRFPLTPTLHKPWQGHTFVFTLALIGTISLALTPAPARAQTPAPASSSTQAGVRTWQPASEPALTLDLASGYLRATQPPGFVQFLVRVAEPSPANPNPNPADSATAPAPAAPSPTTASSPTAARTTLMLNLRRTGTPGEGQTVTVATDGWQRLTLPYSASAWSAGRTPSVSISAPGFTGTLQFARADVTNPAWPRGPGLSDAQLLRRLDLTRPELSAVRARQAAGDVPGAMTALATYFRQRAAIVWELPALPTTAEDRAQAIAAAARVLAGETTMLNNSHTYPGGKIDWYLDPTAQRPNQTDEWIWSINRHECALPLQTAFRVSQDERYAGYWASLVQDWTAAMPVPSTDWGWRGSGWRLLEAGLRMGEFWPAAWTSLATAPGVSDEALLTMVKSFWEHGEFLARQPPVRGNFFVLGMTGLHALATLFPEFQDAAAWRIDAANRLQAYVLPNTEADGGWYERSPSYHQWIVDKMAIVLAASRRNGHADDFPPAFRQHVLQMATWNLRVSTPDRLVPSLNDSSRLSVASLGSPLLLDEFPASAALRWAAATAPDPSGPPLPASELMASGYGVMRSSWASDATYVLFDVGPMGGGHGHLDALNILYAPAGRLALFDGTGGTYDKTPFRPWSVSTASHNTVLVDQSNQFRPKDSPADPTGALPAGTPPAVFTDSPTSTYSSGWHIGGYGKDGSIQVRHRRELGLAKASGILLVLDTLTPADQLPHAYDLRWQVLATEWQGGGDKGSVVVPTRDGQPLLALVPLNPLDAVRADSAVTTPAILGWNIVKRSPSTGEKSGPPTPALTVRHLRDTTGPVTLLTALVPGPLLGTTLPRVTPTADGWSIDLGTGQPPLLVSQGTTAGRSWLRLAGPPLTAPAEFTRTAE